MNLFALRQRAFSSPAAWVIVLLWLGLALRLIPLLGDPLHQDEALYGFWGRLISSGRDPWLATAPVDKPPLALYLIAGSQAAFGASEFATRLPGLAASLLSIPLTYALARRLYGHFCAVLAAAVMALTPFAVLFGATAFADSLLVAWWLAACYAALAGRWGWAGLALGLAFATKQQALVLAPLVVGWPVAGGRRASGRFVVGVGLVVAGVWAWDVVRIVDGAARGFWGQGVDSYGGLRLIWPAELTPRLRAWSRLGGYMFAWPGLGALWAAGVGALLARDLTQQRRTRPALTDLTLITFALFYLFFHLLLAFPVWDRYLLPLLPLAALLVGRLGIGYWVLGIGYWVLSMQRVKRALRFPGPRSAAEGDTFYVSLVPGAQWKGIRFTFYVLLALSLVGGGVMAAAGQIPVGGDHGAYDGLDEVIEYIQSLPVGTVLYDRWLSWHYDFYLFDAYVYRAGFPSPSWLAADAAAFYDGRPRYVVTPSWESAARLERALADVGLMMSPALTTQRRDGTTSFVVWEIGE